MEVIADVYQRQQQTQQQSQRNKQSTQTRPYSNAERQRRYREKRKADKMNACTTFSQLSDVQPQQEQPQHDAQLNKRQPLSNAERQRKYRKLLRERRQQKQQMQDINAITVLSNTPHTSSIHQLQNVEQAKHARKRHLNKQRQRRFRARQRFESPSTSSHQAQTESETLQLNNHKTFEEFDQKYTQNSFSHSCNICDHLWFKKDLHTTSDNHTEILQRIVTTDDIIARVYNYLQAEYEQLKSSIDASCDLSPLANILRRTALATGVSEQAVSVILEKRKRTADEELDAGAAKCAKLIHDYREYVSSVPGHESSSGAPDKEQDDDEQTDDDSQEQDECELKMEIKIEDESDTFDPLQLQMNEIDSAMGHVISPTSKFGSDEDTIVRKPVQVKIEPDMIVRQPTLKPKLLSILPMTQLRGSACEVTRVVTVNRYSPPLLTPHSSDASTSEMVCAIKSEPDVP